MRVGVPSEVKNNEFRVACTPAGVNEFVLHGHEVRVQRGAGDGSSLTDDDYRAAVAAFLADAADDGRPDVASTSFTAYGAWVKSESDASRTAPSGAAVRQHFGSWAAAKGAVARG